MKENQMNLSRYIGKECVVQFRSSAWIACIIDQGSLNVLQVEGKMAQMPFLHGNLLFEDDHYYVVIKDNNSKRLIEIGINPSDILTVTTLAVEPRIQLVQ